MGMMLALVGLYGLVASMVNRRTREIGIRLAIGAQPGAVLRLFLRQGSRPVLSGLGAGLVLSLAAGRALRAMFPGSQPGNDTYLMVAFAMLAASMLAVYIPARAASRVDPMTTLRDE
jgi:putative ABC transport system permease protein